MLAPRVRPGSSRDAEREARRAAASVLRNEPVAPLGAAREESQPVPSPSPPSPTTELFQSPGKPLEEGTRAFYEERFGHDFSNVRIHDDSESTALNRRFGARAFAVGHHVAFAGEERSQIAPGSPLLAHELAHVVQQRQSGVARVMRQSTEGEPEILLPEPCPGSCHAHVVHYERVFGGGMPVLISPPERKQVPVSQEEMQIVAEWLARSTPDTASPGVPVDPPSNELKGGKLKADVAAEYAKHKEEFEAKPNNRVQIIRFEVPDESDPDWSKYRASQVSAEQKMKTFTTLGVKPEEKVFPRTVSSKDFSAYIAAQNADAGVFGIIVQLPTPTHLKGDVGKIAPEKDLDALSAGKDRAFQAPATADGVVRLVLAFWEEGQTVAVIGGGSDTGVGALGFVGGAVVELLRERGITVEVFEKGDDLRDVKNHDLVVTAVGTPRVVTKDHLKAEHELVVDTGFIPETGGGTVVGDVDESARSIPRYITAVPGGTGPVEMAVLMERAAKLLDIEARTWEVELRDGELRAVFIE